jgi:hypothetical protein
LAQADEPLFQFGAEDLRLRIASAEFTLRAVSYRLGPIGESVGALRKLAATALRAAALTVAAQLPKLKPPCIKAKPLVGRKVLLCLIVERHRQSFAWRVARNIVAATR